MRTRTTLILLVIAGLLGAALMKSDRLLPKAKGAMENPLPFEKAKIDEVIVESAEASLRLSITERRWQVGKPKLPSNPSTRSGVPPAARM